MTLSPICSLKTSSYEHYEPAKGAAKGGSRLGEMFGESFDKGVGPRLLATAEPVNLDVTCCDPHGCQNLDDGFSVVRLARCGPEAS